MSPFYALANIAISIKEAFDTVLSLLGLKRAIPRRRNRGFERAGREVPHVDSFDSKALTNMENSDKQRDREILNRVIYENRMLRKNNAKSKELRKMMHEENMSVSQGAAISHLAKMNAKEKEKQRNGEKKKKQEAEQEKPPADDKSKN